LERNSKQVLEEIAESLKALCNQVTVEVVSGPTVFMIDTVAKDGSFDLIVVAPGHHSRVERFLLGGTSTRLLEHARQPVVVLKGSQDKPRFGNVVFAADGSKECFKGVADAVRLFRLTERSVKCHLVNVVSVAGPIKYVSPVRFVAAIEDNLLMSGEACLAQGQKELTELGVKDVEIHLKTGDPSEEVLALTKQVSGDLIVTGSSGHAAVRHFLLGSVSRRIASHSPCSVAVMR